MKKTTAFTIVELLTALAIISLLVGILMPTLSFIRSKSKNTAQRVQLATIDMALLTFKNDTGYYPPSDSTSAPPVVDPEEAQYCGAQKLAEALLGWDLMGFHPDTAWRADGLDRNGGFLTYDPQKQRDNLAPIGVPDTLDERVGSYLELATTKAFRLGDTSIGAGDGLYRDPTPLTANTYVLCDVFGAKSLRVGERFVKAGTPILYFRANTSSKTISQFRTYNRIYDVYDNVALLAVLGSIASGEKEPHPIGSRGSTFSEFYNYIIDPKATSMAAGTYWPFRADSYLLITAGRDGLYGNDDDICNFTK